MNSIDYEEEIRSAIRCLSSPKMSEIISSLTHIRNSSGWVVLCGNGGSAAIADHMATDWLKGVYVNSKKPFKVLSLCSNIPLISAVANDFSYDDLFSRQLDFLNLGSNDLLFTISGSGNSKNVVNAVHRAKDIGMKTISISGFGGGIVSSIAELSLVIQSHDMQIVEDIFSCIGHYIFKRLSQKAENSS